MIEVIYLVIALRAANGPAMVQSGPYRDVAQCQAAYAVIREATAAQLKPSQYSMFMMSGACVRGITFP